MAFHRLLASIVSKLKINLNNPQSCLPICIFTPHTQHHKRLPDFLSFCLLVVCLCCASYDSPCICPAWVCRTSIWKLTFFIKSGKYAAIIFFQIYFLLHSHSLALFSSYKHLFYVFKFISFFFSHFSSLILKLDTFHWYLFHLLTLLLPRICC